MTSLAQIPLVFEPVPDPPAMTEEEAAVWRELRWRSGKPHAIQIRELQVSTGLNERDIKGAVEGLIVNHGTLVGSSRVKEPFGYYLIVTKEELEETCRALEHQADKMKARVAALRRAFDEMER